MSLLLYVDVPAGLPNADLSLRFGLHATDGGGSATGVTLGLHGPNITANAHIDPDRVHAIITELTTLHAAILLRGGTNREVAKPLDTYKETP